MKQPPENFPGPGTKIMGIVSLLLPADHSLDGIDKWSYEGWAIQGSPGWGVI